MAEPHTLILGDEIGRGLYDALQEIPGTGAIWQDTSDGSDVARWANSDEASRVLDRISKGVDSHVPDRMPDTVIVSLGRAEILTEPAKGDPEGGKQIAADVASFVDQLQKLGLKVLWVLPPASQNEGAWRGVIAKALADKGVRVFPAQHSFTDPQAHGQGQTPVPIPTATLEQMAALLATWAPLGAPQIPIGPRRPSSAIAPGYLASLSRPAKVGIGVAVVALLGSAAYAGWRKYG